MFLKQVNINKAINSWQNKHIMCAADVSYDNTNYYQTRHRYHNQPINKSSVLYRYG